MLGPEEAWRTLQRAGDGSRRRPLVRALARAGYFARAAVYAVIAALALSVALGTGGRTTDTRGALATLARAPAGK
jgi:hypothetical protein